MYWSENTNQYKRVYETPVPGPIIAAAAALHRRHHHRHQPHRRCRSPSLPGMLYPQQLAGRLPPGPTTSDLRRVCPGWPAKSMHTGESARRLYQLGSGSVAASRHGRVAAKATVATLFCRSASVRYGRRWCPASFGLIKVRKTAWRHGWNRFYLFRVTAIGGRSIWHCHCLARTSTSCHSTNT